MNDCQLSFDDDGAVAEGATRIVWKGWK